LHLVRALCSLSEIALAPGSIPVEQQHISMLSKKSSSCTKNPKEFRNTQYQERIRLVCSKVDTRPTLEQTKRN
jgi:hypothetical protein